jgi:hypothetical protein
MKSEANEAFPHSEICLEVFQGKKIHQRHQHHQLGEHASHVIWYRIAVDCSQRFQWI